MNWKSRCAAVFVLALVGCEGALDDLLPNPMPGPDSGVGQPGDSSGDGTWGDDSTSDGTWGDDSTSDDGTWGDGSGDTSGDGSDTTSDDGWSDGSGDTSGDGGDTSSDDGWSDGSSDDGSSDDGSSDDGSSDDGSSDDGWSDDGSSDDGSSDDGWSDDGSGDDGNAEWYGSRLTWYTSYPDPNSEECWKFNGCMWAGYFAAFPTEQKSLEWVMSHNIAAVHEEDFDYYVGKTLRVRHGGNTIDAVVYDMCHDSDCNGCCTQNKSQYGFLIDLESFTYQRFGSPRTDYVEWYCVDC